MGKHGINFNWKMLVVITVFNDNGIYPVQPTWTLQFVGVGRPLSLSELVIIGRKRAYGFEMTVIICNNISTCI